MKRKTLTTAVLAGLTGVAGMINVASAVNVNPDGLGQVLLYPFYTARGGNDTLISVVNTTSAGKAVKIRFLEALNSREVLDFNIYLSPFDVWTAAVTDLEAQGRGDGPGIITADTTCTAPYIFGETNGDQEFVDFQFASGPVDTDGDGTDDFPGTQDGGPTGIERTASGYIEIIEMGTMVDASALASAPASSDPEIVPYSITHDESGVPRDADCSLVNDLWRTPGSLPGQPPATPTAGELGFWKVVDPTFGFDDPAMTGGLFGGASIINVPNGLMFSYNATAVDSFWPATSAAFHTDPGTVSPSLASSSQTQANVFVNGVVDTTNWVSPGPFALNAALTLSQLMNEYAINAGALQGRTEWVLTFPTKGLHVDNAVGGPNEATPLMAPIPPFTKLWEEDSPNSCDIQSFNFWNREEGPTTPDPEPGDPGDVIISPPPPPTPGVPVDPNNFVLCREANVVRFVNDGTQPDATEILGEPIRLDDTGAVDPLSYTNFNLPSDVISGWVRFNFGGFTSTTSTDGDVINGLPVVGFAVNTFTNDNIQAGVRANFGGTFQHRGTRTLAAPAP